VSPGAPSAAARETRLTVPLAWPAADWLIDRPALWGIARLYFPLSRLWAAADAAGEDAGQFLAEAPIARLGAAERGIVRAGLAAVARARKQLDEADADWRAAFFAAGAGPDEAALAAAERRRHRAALGHMMQRMRFAPLLIGRRVPAVRLAIPSKAEIRAAYGESVLEPWRPFMPPAAPPPVEASRPYRFGGFRRYWLRFASPFARVGGTAWARVTEPEAGRRAPTLLFGNGIGVEFDYLTANSSAAWPFARGGFRVVEIESAWHGRRRRRGFYGGEPFLAGTPLAGLDLFAAQAQELAVLTDWARATHGGPVASGGVSMGALAARLAAIHAAHWPAPYRPDALVFITVCDRLHELAFDSALTKATGVSAAVAAAGWTKADAAQLRVLADPESPPPVPADRIVAVLGSADRITPYSWAAAELDRWAVPAANRFVGRGGHFSTQMALSASPKVVRRLAAIMAEI
jgi:hypothetical protein